MRILAVTGYASLDYPVELMGNARGDSTTLIGHRVPDDWPRLGGCPAYVAAAAVQRRQRAAPVTWVGSDAGGETFISQVKKTGAETSGIEQLQFARSPCAILAYQADGSCICLFDPAFRGKEKLSNRQKSVIERASHLCVSVGPPQITAEILSCRSRNARLYWILKNDRHCFGDEICKVLSREADVIFCNRAERKMIAGSARNPVIVETRGTGGLAVTCGHEERIIGTDPIEVRDSTGAGDTLAGGYIAAEMSGITEVVEAARMGIACAASLLEQRQRREKRSNGLGI